MLLGISILYSSIVYLLATSALTWRTQFREYSHHVSALQSLYDAVDIGMGSIQRGSDPAIALARDAINLYRTLLHERESLRKVGQQYDRPELFIESAYA